MRQSVNNMIVNGTLDKSKFKEKTMKGVCDTVNHMVKIAQIDYDSY